VTKNNHYSTKEKIILTETDLRFPVIYFCVPFLASVEHNFETLTTATKVGLKKGSFDNMLIVGSDGKAVKIRNARKLHGIGPFWGYNIFLNQKIKVELVKDGDIFDISIDDVRNRVLQSFKKWHGWAARGDFRELKREIERTQTISEIINLLKE
jgi:hypothetical protein